MAVCLYVAVKAGRPFHPQKHDENGVPLADRYGRMFVCDPSDIVSRYGKVQHHLRNGIPNFTEEAEREPKSVFSVGEDPFHDEAGIGEGVYMGLTIPLGEDKGKSVRVLETSPQTSKPARTRSFNPEPSD